TLIVLVFVIAGILLTLCLHRPDADDELYLGMAFSLLAHADQPLQQLPGYGPEVLSRGSVFTGTTQYDQLRAALSLETGLPLLNYYFLFVPPLMWACTVIV